MLTRHFDRDERGAAALIFALTAIFLFGIGAFAVDIGQAYAKKSLEQTDVDVAVMAAAAELTSSGACNPEVVTTATEYLNKAENKVAGQYPLNLGGSPGDQDGYISCKDWRVDLWAPASRADFALAGVLPGAPDGIDVNAHAAAQIKAAAGASTLPFFVADGCDYGQQSIRNPSGPSPTPAVPSLVPVSSTQNNASFVITPESVPAGTMTATITISGNGMRNVDTVGFSNATGAYSLVTVPTVTTNGTTSFTVAVPSDVLATEDVWYVRVKTTGGEWSQTSRAKSFTVGDPKLYCDGSNEGNFGTLNIPRTDATGVNAQLAWNMIKGLQATLAIHPSPNGECSGDPGSIESTSTPVDGTNCVATKTGVDIAAANAGLLGDSGIVGGAPGRLDHDSTSNCSRTGDNSRTAAVIKGKHINDDLLSCFITNDAHISDLVAGNSVGQNALSSDIFLSPRFFYLPVLDSDPTMGSKSWPIIDFRPAFISDQSISATHDAPGTISDFDGLVAGPSGIEEVKVILFDESALPEFAPTVGGEADYTGSGPKALVLVE